MRKLPRSVDVCVALYRRRQATWLNRKRSPTALKTHVDASYGYEADFPFGVATPSVGELRDSARPIHLPNIQPHTLSHSHRTSAPVLYLDIPVFTDRYTDALANKHSVKSTNSDQRMPVIGNGLQRRWNDADGEKVGLWLSLGIIISIIIFTILLGFLNQSLENPLAQLHKLQTQDKNKDTTINDLTTRINNLNQEIGQKDARLQANSQEIRGKDDRITVLNAERDSVRRERDGTATMLARTRAELNEANALRPRIGQQETRIRELQRDLQRAEEERDAERQTNSNNARRLAFVTARLAEGV